MLSDEPEKFWPALEVHHLTSCGLGQALEAGIRGQSQGHATTAQQETNLLGAGVLEKMCNIIKNWLIETGEI